MIKIEGRILKLKMLIRMYTNEFTRENIKSISVAYRTGLWVDDSQQTPILKEQNAELIDQLAKLGASSLHKQLICTFFAPFMLS